MSALKAFHGDSRIKEKYLRRVRAHRKADEIIKGQYWSEGKGCAVGCTIHSSEHNAYETELGIPEWLAQVEDSLFEGMSVERSKSWPEEFLKAIKPGVDLEKVKTPFVVFILKNTIKSMAAAKYDEATNPDVKKAIKQNTTAVKEMIRCHKDELDLSAAMSVAWSLESAVRSVVESAEWSATIAVRSAEYEKYADYLLKLFKEEK